MSKARQESSLATIGVLILLGASTNISVVYLINRFIFPNPFPLDQFYVIRVFGGAASLVLLPFLLSIILARFSPVGRIVPVSDIHTATIALLLVTLPYYDNFQIFGYLMFTFVGLAYSSQQGASFLGYPVDAEEVEVRGMQVWMDWEELKEVLEDPDRAANFGLDLTRTETKGNEVLFMRDKGARIQFFLRLVEHIKGAECFVYMFAFEEGKYGMVKAGEAIQFLNAHYYFLRGILDDWKPSAIKHQDDITIPNQKKMVIETIAGRVSGASLTLWRLNKSGWLMIGALLAALVAIPIYFFLQGDSTNGLVTVAVVLVSLVPIVQGIRNRKKGGED